MAEVRRRAARTRRLSRAALEHLARPLDPALVSERITEEGEILRYLEGWRAIEQANAVFGHDGWGAEVVGEVAYRPLPAGDRGDNAPAGIYTATVRVTARGCPPHSDVGATAARNQTAEEHAAAPKAAVTDGLKRALRHFGARFGNGLGAVPGGATYPVAAAAAPGELRRRVLEIAAGAGADEERTRAWVEQRYGRPLAELDAGSLLACVDALSRGLHRRNGARAA